ncbi:ABC transporter permease [Roseisalinus antarcticus]|uniref:Oligopeptide transport system permease protein OppC n=1 Tax=Roseisalinus antarcticus TaxID=254357 RepID=A0A1Y5TVZ1_9RHOB|nr:ABC transporter permease [Roseisalinus antarcticus]SLN74227.1 Oligopeptide transport system permease protein OppC [Roseisalinus antarcticus]
MTDAPLMTQGHTADPRWAPLVRDAAAAEVIAAPVRTYWQDVRARLWRNRPAMAGLAFIVLLVLAAIFGPMISAHSYRSQNLALSNLPPFLTVQEVGGADARQTVFANPGNLQLYAVEAGHVTGLVPGGRRDMINRRTVWQIGGAEVILDYSDGEPVLRQEDGPGLAEAGRQWNRTYLFGTDQLGRDVLVRQLYGARISLAVAFVATLVNFMIGVTWGGVSGYLGGRVDLVMMRIVEIISTIPLTLYVILMMVVLQSGLLSVMLAIGTVFWVDMARVVRGQMLTLKSQDYVAAARTMGASTRWIMSRHLLPNTIGPILVTATMLIPSAIFIESFMSFIGLGVTPPQASWGTLTSDAVETLRRYPHQLFFPAAAISLTMFAFNFLGDGLRDALDPRLRT